MSAQGLNAFTSLVLQSIHFRFTLFSSLLCPPSEFCCRLQRKRGVTARYSGSLHLIWSQSPGCQPLVSPFFSSSRSWFSLRHGSLQSDGFSTAWSLKAQVLLFLGSPKTPPSLSATPRSLISFLVFANDRLFPTTAQEVKSTGQ